MNTMPVADFAPFAARMRAAGLGDTVIETFRHYYETLAAGNTGLIAEATITPLEGALGIAEVAGYAEVGAANLGRAAVLKLNGGLGTSMGLDGPKSLLMVRENLTFLDIIVRQNLHLRRTHACDVPLLFLNSFNTEDETLAALAHYPELMGTLPLSVMQNKVPKVLRDTLAPAAWPADRELEWCPPGHGEVYLVLYASGVLDALLAQGITYLFLSNADNLGATLDPAILGYLLQHQVPFLMEVAQRTEVDKKGGHVARREDGRLILREVAQCPEEDLPAFQDVERHRFFNTNNLWIHLPTLHAILAERGGVLKLPMIRNAKTLDPRDSSSPGVYQLETAMGAAIEVFGGAQVLHVSRERFMPVKVCADLLALRSDIYTMSEDCCLRPNPRRTLPAIVLDLDGRFYKLIADFERRFPATPSLVECERLQVRGDVLFEPHVTMRGTLRLNNSASEQRRVPAGTILESGDHEL
jgi:UTP--glucose-1-phosphate uridylyltransferase